VILIQTISFRGNVKEKEKFKISFLSDDKLDVRDSY